jgi:hypothetical protein
VYTTVQRHDDESDEQQAEQQQADEGDALADVVDSMQQQPDAGTQTTDRFEEVPSYDRCTYSHQGTPILDASVVTSSTAVRVRVFETCIHLPCEKVLRRRRGLLHSQEELGEGGGGHARHIKLAVSVLLAMTHHSTPCQP